jgi:hypothetical protein
MVNCVEEAGCMGVSFHGSLIEWSQAMIRNDEDWINGNEEGV